MRRKNTVRCSRHEGERFEENAHGKKGCQEGREKKDGQVNFADLRCIKRGAARRPAFLLQQSMNWVVARA
jgi:hypothetical protein